MSKDLWIAIHQDLIEQYMDEHPEATEREAADKTADRVSDRIADLAEFAHDQHKERNL
jgi:hypothetical protein